MKTQEKRNGAIDFWKFVFAFLILLYHSRFIAKDQNGIFIGGSIAVEFFFIVSGFLMAASSGKRINSRLPLANDTVDFIKRKFLSLLPDMYIAWVIGFIIRSIANDNSLKEIIKNLMSSVWDLLLLWQSGLSGYRVNFVSWYLSAMLLSMVILYPLLRKYKDFFLYIIAPTATVIIYGILYQSGTLRSPSIWYGFVYKGVVRAIAGLCLGCTCYVVCTKLKSVTLRRLPRVLISFIEVAGYVAVIAFSYKNGGSQTDYLLVLIFAISITLSFSRQGILSDIYDRKSVYWLGSFSLPLFFGHGFWSQNLSSFFPDKDYNELLPFYLGISILTAIFIMILSKLMRKFWHTYSAACKSLFIAMTGEQSG